MYCYFCVFIFIVNLLAVTNGHADSVSCSTALSAGTRMMGRSAVSSSSRSVVVKRGSTVLTSGDSYVPGETLSVSISSTSGEWIYETSNARFSGGICSNLRSLSSSPSIVMPSSGTVTIKVAWATSQSTVSISNLFTLVAGSTGSPTLTPSAKPSASPTTAPTRSPTPSPTASPPTPSPSSQTDSPTLPIPTATPTFIPTAIPTTPKPSVFPTRLPTPAPSTPRPTAKPSVHPSSNPTSTPSTYANVEASFSASQSFTNITVEDMDSPEGQTAFKRAVAGSTSHINPGDVNILSTQGQYSDFARILTGTRPPTSILVMFEIVFDSPTGSSSVQALFDTIQSQLETAFSTPQFMNLLHMEALAAGAVGLAYAVVQPNGLAINDPVIISRHEPTMAPTTLRSQSDNGLRITILIATCVLGIPALILVMAPSFKSSVTLGVFSTASGTFMAIAIALVAAWATNSSSSGTSTFESIGFLGQPSWANNKLAFHPVLQVAGFYCGQVLSMMTLAVIPTDFKSLRLIGHWSGHCIAVACLIPGMVAIVQYKHDRGFSSLTSMHSWLGVVSICLYFVNLGFSLWYSWADDRARRAVTQESANPNELAATTVTATTHGGFEVLSVSEIKAVHLHQWSGLISLGVSSLAIVVGISEQLGQYGCANPSTAYGQDPNPAGNFGSFPLACRLAFGVGLICLLIVTFVSIAIVGKDTWVK